MKRPSLLSILIVLIVMACAFYAWNEYNYRNSQKKPSATSPSSEYVPLLGNTWSRVDVYYGTKKEYAFMLLGGANCSTCPSGRCLRVQYEDFSEEWKDRKALVESGIYFVKRNDPAIDAAEWYEYDCP